MSQARPPDPPWFRHAFLLASLVVVVGVRPFVSERVFGVGVIDLMFFVTVIAGVLATVHVRKLRVAGVVLAVVMAGSQVAWFAADSERSLVLWLVCTLAFYCFLVTALVSVLFRAGTGVTIDTFCCAISVYFLLGMIWAIGFVLLELAAPGSFVLPDTAPASSSGFDRFIGFSFATLTTLGYGNIAPASPRADALTSLEAIVGQGYIAIVIARLVAIQLIRAADPKTT